MNVKLMLVTEGGEVLDSTDLMSPTEWNRARVTPMGAVAVLGDLPTVADDNGTTWGAVRGTEKF